MQFPSFTKSPSNGITAADYLRAKSDAEVSPFGLKETLETSPESVLVVDVRDKRAFDERHILGSVGIPGKDMVTRLASLPKDRTIVCYCWDETCDLAPRAALELTQKGFRAKYLVGGIEVWHRKGFPVAKTSI